ncbi:follicle-stimulating hormone receptor-like [Amphiura filiformis]|uniref:follicle-stimulating hormone receptor-like n=1 Tax=Amphiura filiformis TaxID=82378 RepID=UPI003B21CC3A
MDDLYILDLSWNQLQYLPKHAFAGVTITSLDLGYNPLRKLDEDVFVGLKGLTEIILRNTLITYLPTNGLKYITTLDLQQTYTLKKFPPVFRFERIETAKLYYFSHCCAFNYLVEQNPDYTKLHKIRTEELSTECPVSTVTPSPSVGLLGNSYPSSQNYGYDMDDSYPSMWAAINDTQAPSSATHMQSDESKQSNVDQSMPGLGQNEPIDQSRSHNVTGSPCNPFVEKDYSAVKCTPKPDAFNPCSDVMGYIFLRIVVWFIAMTALIGNFIVLLVLLAYRSKMTVPKFLMCNLSFADLCMGVYLLMVASVDLHTLREYFNYAISWQHEAGCKLAGFISIFSSELSVFSLTVLTIERWYTIIYAIDLNKRIRLRQAAKIIIGAWLFAILIAALPMLGVGSYGVTSMCIPFYIGEDTSAISYAYVLFILLFNALAFLIICACYIKMYLTVHNPHTVMQRKDSKVAKRMAVLIFTDFACWAPIAIFGLSAAFGKPLLTVNQSKVLIVLFYPINSCANPFLYAIFTKAFRRDFFVMLAKHGMFEKQAMKYRGAHSDHRSYSQAHSYTSREGQNKCHYRSSSSTQITNDARSSVAVFEKDTIHDIDSPDGKTTKPSHITIPLMPLKDRNHSQHSLSPSDHPCEERKPPAQTPTPETANESANNNNKQPLMKKLSAVLHVDYTISDLDTVPEERCSSPDNPEIYLEVPNVQGQSFIRAPDAHDYLDDDDDFYEDAMAEDLKELENERKNSKTDSGIQSNTTTPTDKADQQIVNKTRVLELLNKESDQGTETTL